MNAPGALLLAAAGAANAGELPLTVEFGGCEEVVREVCQLAPDASLTLWVRTAPQAEVTIRGASKRSPAVAVQGGRRYELSPKWRSRQITVSAIDGARRGSWQLRLSGAAKRPRLSAAQEALDGGKPERVVALLAQAEQSDADANALRGRAYNMLGDTTAARQHLRAAVDAKQAAGRTLSALKDATVLAYSLMLSDRDLEAAGDALAPFKERTRSAEANYFLQYFLGLIAYNGDDERGTLRAQGAAADQAERMGWDALQLTAEQIVAVQWQTVGRRSDASALLEPWVERLDRVLPSACDQAMFLNNLGWTRLLVREAGELGPDPMVPLRRAHALLSTITGAGPCNEQERINVLLNLSLGALHAQDSTSAERYLAEARAATSSPEMRLVLWSLDIEARLALLQQQPERALSLARQLESLGSATQAPQASWRASVRQALAYEQLGEPQAALEAWAKAQAMVQDRLLNVPIHEGRETLLASQAWAAVQHLTLLLAERGPEAAWRLARQVPSRSLHSLRPGARLQALAPAERARWETALAQYQETRETLTAEVRSGWLLPREELDQLMTQHAQRERALRQQLDDALSLLGPATAPSADAARPPPGTLEIVAHPLSEGWVTLVASSDRVQAFPGACEPAPATALVRCLLDPAAALLRRAEHVRFILPADLQEVDVHALALDGAPLGTQVPISYALAMNPVEQASESSPDHALVVGDPQGNLPAASEEIRYVRNLLQADGKPWRIATLQGAEAAQTPVSSALTDAKLFHYAGHARALGQRGWDSELVLGRRRALDITDILALPRTPSMVVLSGCDTATTGDSAEGRGGIGLAQAFIASGTDTVLATTRPVRDETALALVRDFYTEWLAGTAPDRALQSAQLALRARDAEADWSAFRLLTR